MSFKYDITNRIKIYEMFFHWCLDKQSKFEFFQHNPFRLEYRFQLERH